MVLVVCVLLAGALGCLAIALLDVPARRVERGRVDAHAVDEVKPLLERVSDAVVHGVERSMTRQGWRPFTTEELELAGIRSSIASLVVLTSCVSFVAFAMGTVLLGSMLLGLLLGALVPVLSKLVVRLRAARRRKRFAQQLGPLLQLLAASLRAGHSLPLAMDAAAREADPPMAGELGRIINEYRLGRDLVQAMEQVAARMRSLDFLWIAQAIEAQRETGGNLNEILDQVAETIRERGHIRQQVVALSAEGRISAYILMALPVCIGGYYCLIAGETMSLFIATFIGKLLVLGAAVMYVIGGLWMRSIVRIEF